MFIFLNDKHFSCGLCKTKFQTCFIHFHFSFSHRRTCFFVKITNWFHNKILNLIFINNLKPVIKQQQLMWNSNNEIKRIKWNYLHSTNHYTYQSLNTENSYNNKAMYKLIKQIWTCNELKCFLAVNEKSKFKMLILYKHTLWQLYKSKNVHNIINK